MSLSFQTPIIELHRHEIARITTFAASKLAAAVAAHACKAEPAEATVEDLLNYFPMRYEDRSNLVTIDQLAPDTEASVEVYTRSAGAFQVKNNRNPKQNLFVYEITAGDRERSLKPVVISWFLSGKNAKSIVKWQDERFTRGSRFVAHGIWKWDDRRNTFALKLQKADELEMLPIDDGPDSFGLLAEVDSPPVSTDSALPMDNEGEADPALEMIHTKRIVPVYRKLGNFHAKRLREIVYDIIRKLEPRSVPDSLPELVTLRHKLVSRFRAIAEVHFPPQESRLADYELFRSDAHRRLIFEEFFWLSFGLQLVRGERKKEPKGTIIEITAETRSRIKKLLPFTLTDAQRRVVKTIFDDLRSDAPMNRLVQGDVGSGKTIVAFISMFVAMENGYQSAMMAPTEILAEQHFRNAERFYKESGYNVALLIGSLKSSEKRKTQKAIADGDVHVVIGTQALIQEAVAFENLGLIVVDEQHRFGVLQRAALTRRGFNPDVLVMTATPIPRSLAMTVYGDLDVSVIDELPPGRTPIKTVVLGEDQRSGVYKGIRREIDLGRQVYVVYPLIDESDKLDLKAATLMYEELRDDIFPDFRVGLLHGKMQTTEKEVVMSRFVSGELDILVSTTVIEVGVDVPNASLMVIEHAERFGLSQLHQLRGRVGRGADRSYCVLLTDFKKTAVAKERLGIMEKTSDGFKIAEKDLEIRGQGEILGTRQSGLQTFNVANIVRDFDILEAARREAEVLLTEKRLSKETGALIDAVRKTASFKLAGIG